MSGSDAFAGKTVVVTGGGTGLGFEVARGFAAGGAGVVIASRNAEHLEPARERIEAEGGAVLAVVTDVRRPAQVARLLESSLERFGKVDLLINNAAGNFFCPSKDLSPGGWKVVIDIALNGVFYCSREIGRHMIERGEGRIVNVVASYAWTGGPGTVHSAAAKAGVVAMTRTLAVEWAPYGLRVNAVCPGAFQTAGARERLWPTEAAEQAVLREIPLQRFARVEEVARGVLWLCSKEADYINGEVLVMDGGASLGKGIRRGTETSGE